MKNIAICGLYFDQNYGDAVICQSTLFIIKHLLADQVDSINIEIVDLRARSQLDSSYALNDRTMKSFLRRFLGPCIRAVPFSRQIHYELRRERRIKLFFEEKFSKADLILFGGGSLIKFRQQDLYLLVNSAISVASKLRIPVVLHAVGVEGYSEYDLRCRMLKKALTNPVVKSITTRDDLNTLNESYLRQTPWIHRGQTSDSAVWASEVYGVSKKASDTIGIGIIRNKIFREYGHRITDKDLLEMYRQLIDELKNRGFNCVLFTNGSRADLKSALKVQAQVKDIDLIHPKSPRELVETIACFKGIIAARLHANIIAYSLDVPSVGLIWNSKLHEFGHSIGCPERFIDTSDFGNPCVIADTLCCAISKGYDTKTRERVRELTWQTLSDQLQHVASAISRNAGC